MQTKCYKEEKTDAELAKLQISLQLYDKETEHKMILRKQHRFFEKKRIRVQKVSTSERLATENQDEEKQQKLSQS